jgi:hypothetical protein
MRYTTAQFTAAIRASLCKPPRKACINTSKAAADPSTDNVTGNKTLAAHFLNGIAACRRTNQIRPHPAMTVPTTIAHRIHVPGLPARRKKYPAGTPTQFVMETKMEKPAMRPVANNDEL